MGHQDRKNASERARLPVSLEDIWKEIEADRDREWANFVKTADIGRITGKDSAVVLWKAKQIGAPLKYGPRRVAYVSLEDAERVMRELA